MGRSVSTPRDALEIAYASFESADCEDGGEDWRENIDFLQSEAQHAYPSLTPCDEWVGREDHAILKNRLVYVTVSEYCGLVAVCLVPRGDHPELSVRWASQVKLDKLAQCMGTPLRSQGWASNGEQFFQPADGQQRGQMGLGFTSKEGWL